jgi:hypothetical protein
MYWRRQSRLGRGSLDRPRALRFEPFEARHLLAANVFISEIVASNSSGLKDAYGDESDWIELQNIGNETADLTGWHLTDDATNPTKWTFPAKTLAPGATLVVFASSRNSIAPNGELHTNFSLSAGGEYLGLIQADGTTVAHDFAPQYPAQATNFSYGVPHPFAPETLVPELAPVKVMVPTNAALEDNWYGADFDDSGAEWYGTTTGVGFERGSGYQGLIQTDVGNDMYSLNSSVYIRIPFTIDLEGDFTQLTLRMKFDDGFVAYLNGEKIASKNSPDNLVWNSSATLQNNDQNAVNWEDFDVTAFQHLLVDGENVLAIQGMNAGSTSSDFLIVPQLVGVSTGGHQLDSLVYFGTPTPNQPNGAGFESLAPQATYSIPGGVYTSTQSLTLSSSVPGAVIYYTTNGNVPTTQSQVYTAPINIVNSTMVKSLLVAPGMLTNHAKIEQYTRLGANVAGFDSNLPVVIVDTFGRGIGENNPTEAYATFIDVDPNTGRAEITGPVDFAGRAGLRVRGSSSAGFQKQQFAFETWDQLGNDEDSTILGFPTESDYILYAPYSEKSLMQNALAYQWSNEIGRYAVRTRYVEVYLNTNGGEVNSSDYWGVYIFMEKIERGTDRVDIAELDPTQNSEPDITGGYLLKKDRLESNESPFTTSRGHELGFIEPDGLDVTATQKAWIRQYMNDFEAALYGANFRDPVNGYRKYIDTQSFIDHHIMVEMTKNIDGYRLSTFMYKDRGGLLNMGPIWDYNLSLGNANYFDGGNPENWYYPQLSSNEYPWYGRLFQDPDFQQEYIDRWAELRRGVFSTENLVADINAYKDELQEAQVRNFQRWQILGTYVWPNAFVGQTWEEEVQWMTDWLTARVAWMDSNWRAAPTFSSYGEEIGPGFELEIAAIGRQEIYYTLDGSDPRLPGGAINPNAIREISSVRLTLNESVRVKARVNASGNWSGLTEATFVTSERPALRITEIMYHPGNAPAGSEFDDEDFEFIELMNVGDTPLQLAGYSLTGGISFQFPEMELAAGAKIVVAGNAEAFAERYGDNLPVVGAYTDRLANSAEAIQLLGSFDESILDFEYTDDWYPTTDGDGFSLVIVNPLADRNTWGEAASWRPSKVVNGTPGTNEGVAGDTNDDGVVDLTDLNNVRNNFGGTGLGDTDGNGVVDLNDLNAVRNNFGASAPAPIAIERKTARLDDRALRGVVLTAAAFRLESSREQLTGRLDERQAKSLSARATDELFTQFSCPDEETALGPFSPQAKRRKS